jgi:hypothetical protein
MLFKTFEGRLMMALHSPNVHKHKHILLFEMDEQNGELAIINEVTGNWYKKLDDGPGSNYRYNDDCIEEPVFSKIAILN